MLFYNSKQCPRKITATFSSFFKSHDLYQRGCRSILAGVLPSIFIVFSIFLFSCSDKQRRPIADDQERRSLDSLLKTIHEKDSLLSLRKRFEQEGKMIASIAVLRELGKRQRNESRFDDALRTHNEGLKLAEEVKDTIEIIQALNNIGTNYRRMGVLDVAMEYHSRAWKISEDCTDSSLLMKKNAVVSLNGLGNIYMSIGNYEYADSVLRMALAGETELGSATGQAINHANLGSIFESKGLLDSAWLHYREAMSFNQKAQNKLGISLCHRYFGSIHEKEGNYDMAIKEYNAAYQLMQASKDEWHSLNLLLDLAQIYHNIGKLEEALKHLDKAHEMAERIKSMEHLPKVYQHYYLLHKQQGNYRQALDCHVRAAQLQDSLVDMSKLNRIQNVSLSIERNRQAQQMREVQQQYEAERTTRRISYLVFGIVFLLLASGLSMMYYILRTRARNHRILKNLSELRENFFTNITHELRTPLTLILGLSRDIREHAGSAKKTSELSQIIERQGNSLLSLINQLLDISKIKSAIGEPDWRHGDVTSYIRMVVDCYREYAHEKHIELQYISYGPIEMDFVPDYMDKMLNNLLSNAFKFTPEGGKVTVTVRVDDKEVLISVTDTGIGIKAESIDHIFEAFYQAESENKHIGTGVGLALIRQITQSINGKVKVESSWGKGSCFTLRLPMRHGSGRWKAFEQGGRSLKPLLPEEKRLPEDSRTEKDNRTRLLIVEDNGDVARYIGSQLSESYDIFYAPDGKLGLDKARETVPDLIITDLMMPEMDGFELCRQIRADELTSHVPLIILTAKITDTDRIKGIQAGADAYMSKPFNGDELRMRVEKLLEQRLHLREKFSQATADGKETEVQRSELDRHFLKKTIDAIYLLIDKKQADVNALAERLCMSPRQFHRKISALTGESPASYLLQIKMRRAKQLIDSKPQLTIDEVAERCGFEHYSGFYHAFRKAYGVSPSHYKKGAR